MFNSLPRSTDLNTGAEATGRLPPLTLATPIPCFNHSPIPTRFPGSVNHTPDSGTSYSLLKKSLPTPMRIAGSLRRTNSLSDALPTRWDLQAIYGPPPAYLILLRPEDAESDCTAAAAATDADALLTRHQRDWMEGEEGRKGSSLFLARPSQLSSTPATPAHRRAEFGVISHDQDCILNHT